MKINWGTGIVLFFAAFISFILFFVVKTFTQKQYDYDLVSEAYYEEELKFQNTIDHASNANKLENQVVITAGNKLLQIEIPNVDKDVIEGQIQFYRPSNDKLDFVKAIDSEQNTFVFTADDLVTGRWNVTVTWSYASNPYETYYKKESIYF
ncbi:FixH family protein [Wenyingzhuangia sp. IMCC45574]